MSDEANYFRSRARDCRNLAKSSRNREDAAMLEDIAAEQDEEARKIEPTASSAFEAPQTIVEPQNS